MPTTNIIPFNENTGAIALAVSGAGSDNASSSRPSRINNGDYTSVPFLTLQGSANTLSKVLSSQNKAIITLPAGNISGAHIMGFMGGGTSLGFPCGLVIKGATIAPALTTGPTSGTAGTGTSSTFLALPNASTNWTSGEMRGLKVFIIINSGGGASGDSDLPTIRAVSDNTTTGVIPEKAIVGMDNTSVFSLVICNTTIQVDPQSGTAVDSSKLFCLYLAHNQAPVTANFLKFAPASGSMDYGIWAVNNARVRLDGCSFQNVANLSTIRIDDGRQIDITNCHFSGQAKALVNDCLTVDFSGNVLTDGYLEADNCNNVTIDCDAKSCAAAAVTLKHCDYSNTKLTANSNTSTPLVMHSVQRFENSGLAGTNAGANYGIDVVHGGYYDFSGSSLSGAADFRVEGQAATWTQLANQLVLTVYGTAVSVTG